MNQYQIRNSGYDNDRQYIEKILKDRKIPYSITIYDRVVVLEVKIGSIIVARYKFTNGSGELVDQHIVLPRIKV